MGTYEGGIGMESRMCPKIADEPVSTTVCESCEDYREKTNHFVCENPCRWYINHPQPKPEPYPRLMEMYRIERTIEDNKRRAKYFYDRSRPKYAKEMEDEIVHLKYRLQKLRKEKEQWERTQEELLASCLQR